MNRDRAIRPGDGQTWPGPPGVTEPCARAGVDCVWIREFGLLPSPGLVIDYSVVKPFSLAGLGMLHVRRWRDLSSPLPTLSHLALDLTDPRVATINYLVHADDVELPLARALFTDDHPAAWSTALAGCHHALLTVGHCAQILAARTPSAALRALDDSWTGIIKCDNDCVGQADNSPLVACDRHSRLLVSH